MAEISGRGIPTNETAAAVGDIYTDTDTGQKYKCDLAYASKDEKGNDFTYYLWIKLKNESSGSGGTTDYTNLTNKPQINSVNLVGNKTSADLSLLDKAAANKLIDAKLSNLKEDISNIISPNLYNPADAKENTAINQENGTEMSFDGWLATGYIPVSKGEVLYFSSNGEPTAYSTGAFYDKNKQLVDSFGNPNNNNNSHI